MITSWLLFLMNGNNEVVALLSDQIKIDPMASESGNGQQKVTEVLQSLKFLIVYV